MLQSEFIKWYCDNSNITEQELIELGLFAWPCDCGQELCKGWAMVTRETRLPHVELNIQRFKAIPDMLPYVLNDWRKLLTMGIGS